MIPEPKEPIEIDQGEKKRSIIRKSLGYFIQGFFALLPLLLSLYAVLLLLRMINVITDVGIVLLPPSVKNMAGIVIFVKILAAMAIFGGIVVLGYWMRGITGKVLMQRLDKFILTIPAVNIIYRTTREIIELISIRKDSNLMKPVLVEWPSDGRWVLAFVTGSVPDSHDGNNLLTIFMPTSPNPTSGFLLLLPQEKVRNLEAAIKMVLTAGMVRM
jgi:uncharacterized membrane protein